MENEIKETVDQEIKKALKDRGILTIYSNGFIASVGTGDIMIVLTLAGAPIAILNMSYPVAKSLAQQLGESIAVLEQNTGHTIMTIDEIKQVQEKLIQQNQ